MKNKPDRTVESILAIVIITMIFASIFWTLFVTMWPITVSVIIIVFVAKTIIDQQRRRALIKKYTDFVILPTGHVIPPDMPYNLDQDIQDEVWKEYWKVVKMQMTRNLNDLQQLSQHNNSPSRVSDMGRNQAPQVSLPKPSTASPQARTSKPVNTSSTTSYTTSYTTGYTTATPSTGSYNSSSNTSTSAPAEGKKKKKKRWYYPATPKKAEPIAHQYFIQPLDEEEEEEEI